MRAPVVVVLDAGDDNGAARCLKALLPTTPDHVPLLIAAPGARRAAFDELLGARTATWLAASAPEAWNRAAQLAPGADLVLLDGATEVAPSWLDSLEAVA